MRCFVLVATILAVPVLCAQDGYKYRDPAPVIEKQGIVAVDVPCQHVAAGSYNFDANAAALINSQTDARIVNKKGHVVAEHNLETAASGYSPQFGSADKGTEQGSTNTFLAGQGYIQNGLSSSHFQTGHSIVPPSGNYIPLAQLSAPPQVAPQGHPISQVPPPVSLVSQSFGSGSNYAQGYNYQHVSSGNKHAQAFAPLPPAQPSYYRPQHSTFNGQHSANLAGASSQHSTSNGHHSANLAGATSQHSSNLGYQYAPNYAGSQTAQFGVQHSSNHGANFGGANTLNHAGHHSANFAGSNAAHSVGAHSVHSTGHYASNFGSQQAASNFANQHTSNFAHQQQHNFGSQQVSSFGNHQSGAISSFSSSSLGAEGLNGQLGHVIRETVANAPLDPLAEKHIYVHIPPEDLEGNNDQATLVAPQFLPPPKKHYKIVFIKAPSHNPPNYSQLAAAAAPKVEEKTLIYVLSKKPDEPSIAQLQELSQNLHKSSKPEVYFIKYKTQKEGETIQNHITNTVGLTPDQGSGTDASNLIDIRAGGISSGLNANGGASFSAGDSSSTSSFSSGGLTNSFSSSESSSFSSTSGGSLVERKKHDLYGVPLQ